MPITITINKLSLVHKGSEGTSTANIPDFCKSPTIPLPHCNVAFSADLNKGTTSVFADGGNMCANFGSEFARSNGDEGGVGGGIVSGVLMAEASWITHSFDVKFEGKGVNRLTDKMFHNHFNTVNTAGELQKNLAVECSIEDMLDLIKKCPKAAAVLKKAEKALGKTPKITIGPTPDAHGVTNAKGEITIGPTLDCAQGALTLVHELSHASRTSEMQKEIDGMLKGTLTEEEFVNGRLNQERQAYKDEYEVTSACWAAFGGKGAPPKVPGANEPVFSYEKQQQVASQARTEFKEMQKIVNDHKRGS